MKKSVILISVLISVLLISSVFAEDIPNYQDKYVNDFAKLLSADEISTLRTMLVQVEQNTTAEVAVVTVKTCGGDYDGYAMQLVDKWKIGKADKDNGLLELYCQTEKRFVIKTGYGLEGILPDSKIGRMLDENYVPLRDEGKVKEGIIKFTEEIVKVLNQNSAEIISGQTGGSSSSFIDSRILVIFFIIALFSIFSWIKSLKDKNNSNKSKIKVFLAIFLEIAAFVILFVATNVILILIAIIIIIILSRFNGAGRHGGFFMGGGSGGFSGGGFGGGGFGGGGASR